MNESERAIMEAALRTQTERAEAAEAELAKLREQRPVAVYDGVEMSRYTLRWVNGPIHIGANLYAAPVPATAVPTDEQIHAAYRVALGQSIRERDMPEIRKFARALLQSAEVTK